MILFLLWYAIHHWNYYPGVVFIVRRYFITNSISLIDIFVFSMYSLVSFRSLYLSRNLSITSVIKFININIMFSHNISLFLKKYDRSLVIFSFPFLILVIYVSSLYSKSIQSRGLSILLIFYFFIVVKTSFWFLYCLLIYSLMVFLS